MAVTDRIKRAWNAFFNEQNSKSSYVDLGMSSYLHPDRAKLVRGGEKTLVAAIYNRIAIDASSIRIEHVILDDNGRYFKTKDSHLNYCLQTEANIDQSAKSFIRDVVISLLDEGVVAVVPVDTSENPFITGSYDIETLRVGKIVEWYPQHVKVNVYNDRTGQKENLVFPKKAIAIIENPLYSVVNEPNSTLKRLIHKLNLLDAVDEQSSAGKLDLIIQLPYVIKSEARKKQAEERRKDIEMQLAGSKYGIAYTDGTEHITQLNRPIENNLMAQVQYLTTTLYSQLGITEAVLSGTADETAMNNYINRTIAPIMDAIVDEYNRKFLTKTARTQRQRIMYFSDPFRLLPVSSIANIADTFTRNEIMSSNEFRQIIGMKPSDDPKADELHNSNMPYYDEESPADSEAETDELNNEDFKTEFQNVRLGG